MRALSWMWVLDLCGPALPTTDAEALGDPSLTAWCGDHSKPVDLLCAEHDHILGEGVALHALGMVLGRKEWIRSGRRHRRSRADIAQVLATGFHFELFELLPYCNALDMVSVSLPATRTPRSL